MGTVTSDHQAQSRMISARLDILRQELLAPILSIEGYTELLRDHLKDPDFLDDLGKIEQASIQTRGLVYELLEAETEECEQSVRDEQRSKYKRELRNSVGAIAAYSEIILEDMEDVDTSHDDEEVYFNHLIEESGKLLKMLDTLFQADDILGEDAEDSLNDDIHSIFDCFEKSDRESVEVITGDILIVDDNEMNRDMLNRRLKRKGKVLPD